MPERLSLGEAVSQLEIPNIPQGPDREALDRGLTAYGVLLAETLQPSISPDSDFNRVLLERYPDINDRLEANRQRTIRALGYWKSRLTEAGLKPVVSQVEQLVISGIVTI